MNTSLMQLQRLVQLQGLPEPAPDQQSGRQTVAGPVARCHCQLISPARAPTALQGSTSACPAQTSNDFCHFCLCLSLPLCMLSHFSTWQEYFLYSITLIHFQVVLGDFTPLLNCNKVGHWQNTAVTSSRSCSTRTPWKIWEVNTCDEH